MHDPPRRVLHPRFRKESNRAVRRRVPDAERAVPDLAAAALGWNFTFQWR